MAAVQYVVRIDEFVRFLVLHGFLDCLEIVIRKMQLRFEVRKSLKSAKISSKWVSLGMVGA